MIQSTALVMVGVEEDVSGEENLPNECFVCTESEPAPLKSSCLCTDRYIHTDCFVKLLGAQGKTNCAVCAAPYGNLHVKTLHTVNAFSPCGYVTLFVAITIVFICISTIIPFFTLKHNYAEFEMTILWGIASFMACAAITVLLLIVYTCRVYGVCGVLRSCVREKHVICVHVDTCSDVELGVLQTPVNA